MSSHKADIQIGDTLVEVKSDMREQLVANLRRRTRQSSANRQEQVYSGKPIKRERAVQAAVKGTFIEGEPQAVLIKNRNAHLAQDIHQLRSRYAKILLED